MPNYITDDNLLAQLNGPAASGSNAPTPASAASASPKAAPASPLDRALAAENVRPEVADLARSVFQQETSSGKNVKTSNAGAVGPMQVIPATFKSVADSDWDINNPDHNARAGVRYLSQMYDKAGGDPALAAAGYYGGPGAIDKARNGVAVSDPRNPNAPNTLQYAQQVTSRLPQTSSPLMQAANAVTDTIFPSANAATPTRQYVQDPELLTQLNAKPATASPSTAAPLSRTDKVLQGMRDPIDGGAQLLTKILPDSVVQAGNAVNNWLADNTGLVGKLPQGGVSQQIADNEKAYQAARQAGGEQGFDGYRAIGNAVTTLPLAAAAPGAGTVVGVIRTGATAGALSGALEPVTSDNYWGDKIKQIGLGAAAGGATSAAGGAIARLVSPNASTNAELQLLKSEGVRPTIGQTLGGWANALEEQAQSLPIFGYGVTAARNRAREDFNRAAINRTLAPIGEEVQATGQAGVREAGDKLSNAYDSLLSGMTFRPDQQLVNDLSRISASNTLRPQEADMFNTLIQKHITGFGPNGTMSGNDFKVLESSLNNEAKRFSGATDGYQQKLGGALNDALDAFRGSLARSNPNEAPMLNKINEGWANLVRVEGASKSAKNNNGVFTPAQLNGAVQGADASVRDRATARGEALMQDLSNAGQNIIGNKVPDSGTAGRQAIGSILAGLGGAINVGIPAGLAGGALAYAAAPIQRLMGAAVSARPAFAQPLADTIRQLAPGAAPLLAPAVVGVQNDRKRAYADGGLIANDFIQQDDDKEKNDAPGYADGGLIESDPVDDNDNLLTSSDAVQAGMSPQQDDEKAPGYKNGGLIRATAMQAPESASR